MPAKNKRILYVDDQEDMCFLMKIILDHHGFEAITVNTGTEALHLARTKEFDLFLLDTLLPDMSGVELCREIRACDGRTPVVFYSGMERRSDKEAAAGAGAQGYIVKPAEPGAVINAVRTAINQAESKQL